jgi:hypothetical protein
MMATLGRVLLWTVVLVAPGGFLLVPVLAATSLGSRGRGHAAQSWRERATSLLGELRRGLAVVQRDFTKA